MTDKPEPGALPVIYECDDPSQLVPGEYVDGGWELIEHDVLSSDFDGAIEEWPGVAIIQLPPDLDPAFAGSRPILPNG